MYIYVYKRGECFVEMLYAVVLKGGGIFKLTQKFIMDKKINDLHIQNGHKKKLKELQWKIALISDSGKFLTAESFGCKINVTGVSAKKKQIWSLEYDPKEDNVVYLKSHLGRYLKGDLKGKATCETEEEDVGDMEKFSLVYKQGGSGKWAFKNKKTGFFLGCASQEVILNL